MFAFIDITAKYVLQCCGVFGLLNGLCMSRGTVAGG